ncbi:MAG TPA: AraC family transcriptional regulator [Candidatus Hungatella pullicola]|nr:AraC family transcriptional regulator [Candidatus Hungatella pullicola]
MSGGYERSQIIRVQGRNGQLPEWEKSRLPYYEIYYQVSGRSRVFVDHSVYGLGPGSALILKPGRIHRLVGRMGLSWELVLVRFTEEGIKLFHRFCGREKKKEEKCIRISVPRLQRPYVEKLLETMEKEALGEDKFAVLMELCCLNQFLVSLGRCPEDQEEREQREEWECSVEKTASYLYHSCGEKIHLNQAASVCGMSASYFSRKFKEATGFGFKEYLTEVRIRRACILLLTTKDSMEKIAVACGFGDRNYFGDAFAKAMGVSPTAFRRQKGAFCGDRESGGEAD